MRKIALVALLGLSSGAAMAAGNPVAGEQKAAPCAACHGPTGVSPSPAFPNLAGQHASYLEISLKQYQNGERKNAIMAPQAANLSKQDIRDLAAYYAQQQGLYTPKYSR